MFGDGHDRGVKLIGRLMRDSGVHVIYSGLWQTPRSLAISARDEDVDMVACSMMSNSHLVLVPRLIEECATVGRPDMTISVGGIIPQEDVPAMLEAGEIGTSTILSRSRVTNHRRYDMGRLPIGR